MNRITVYNKLVRDFMGDVIAEDGHRAALRTLSPCEFRHELIKKLVEESIEYAESGEVEELADVVAVVNALAGLHFPTMKDPMQGIAAIREAKAEQRGEFLRRQFLLYVERPECPVPFDPNVLP